MFEKYIGQKPIGVFPGSYSRPLVVFEVIPPATLITAFCDRRKPGRYEDFRNSKVTRQRDGSRTILRPEHSICDYVEALCETDDNWPACTEIGSAYEFKLERTCDTCEFKYSCRDKAAHEGEESPECWHIREEYYREILERMPKDLRGKYRCGRLSFEEACVELEKMYSGIRSKY